MTALQIITTRFILLSQAERATVTARISTRSENRLVLDEGLKFGGFRFSFVVVLNYLKSFETEAVIKGYTNTLDSLPLKSGKTLFHLVS